MTGEAWLFLLAVLLNAVNLFLQVFFTIMYSDLEWYVLLLNCKRVIFVLEADSRCSYQRLHQPHRSLQQAQHVHSARSWHPRLSYFPVPDQWLLGGIGPELAIACVEREKVSAQTRIGGDGRITGR